MASEVPSYDDAFCGCVTEPVPRFWELIRMSRLCTRDVLPSSFLPNKGARPQSGLETPVVLMSWL